MPNSIVRNIIPQAVQHTYIHVQVNVSSYELSQIYKGLAQLVFDKNVSSL